MAQVEALGFNLEISTAVGNVFVILFSKGIVLPDEGGFWEMSTQLAVSLLLNGWILSLFVIAFLAMALFSSEGPNWAALVTDVNLPEHRGTVRTIL